MEVMQHVIKILLVACSMKSQEKYGRWFLINKHQRYISGQLRWKLC